MKHTLLLRLAGPLQSWGTQSRFPVRDSGSEPSKSGVVGLVAAALGWHRDQPVERLRVLRLGIRVDAEGVQALDYQTAGGIHGKGLTYGVARLGDKKQNTVLSWRYYLADADFLVGLEGEDLGLLADIQGKLEAPHWPLFLGRKSFVPGVPVDLPKLPGLPDALQPETPLEEALLGYPWPRPDLPVPPPALWPDSLRFVFETPDLSGEDIRRDQPLGAAFATRHFTLRHVTTRFFRLGAEVPIRAATAPSGG